MNHGNTYSIATGTSGIPGYPNTNEQSSTKKRVQAQQLRQSRPGTTESVVCCSNLVVEIVEIANILECHSVCWIHLQRSPKISRHFGPSWPILAHLGPGPNNLVAQDQTRWPHVPGHGRRRHGWGPLRLIDIGQPMATPTPPVRCPPIHLVLEFCGRSPTVSDELLASSNKIHFRRDGGNCTFEMLQ